MTYERTEVKWRKVNDRKFVAEYEGFTLCVLLRDVFGLLPSWTIIYNNTLMESCYTHSPTTNELAARVQAERALTKIIKEMKDAAFDYSRRPN